MVVEETKIHGVDNKLRKLHLIYQGCFQKGGTQS